MYQSLTYKLSLVGVHFYKVADIDLRKTTLRWKVHFLIFFKFLCYKDIIILHVAVKSS